VSKYAEIIRGDTQTISVPVPNEFQTVIGASVALFVVPLNSNPPDVYIDPTALITVQLSSFSTEVDSFDFIISSTASLIPVGKYNWYARFNDSLGNLTSIQFEPSIVEVIPPKGDDC